MHRTQQKNRRTIPNHYCGEWWSSFLLLFTGIYMLIYVTGGAIFPHSFIDGFKAVCPSCSWKTSLIIIGIIQVLSLLYNSYKGRLFSSFFASFLFIWGMLNMLIYARYWHIGVMMWGLFALVNLYTMAKLLSGIIHNYEYNL